MRNILRGTAPRELVDRWRIPSAWTSPSDVGSIEYHWTKTYFYFLNNEKKSRRRWQPTIHLIMTVTFKILPDRDHLPSRADYKCRPHGSPGTHWATQLFSVLLIHWPRVTPDLREGLGCWDLWLVMSLKYVISTKTCWPEWTTNGDLTTNTNSLRMRYTSKCIFSSGALSPSSPQKMYTRDHTQLAMIRIFL